MRSKQERIAEQFADDTLKAMAEDGVFIEAADEAGILPFLYCCDDCGGRDGCEACALLKEDNSARWDGFVERLASLIRPAIAEAFKTAAAEIRQPITVTCSHSNVEAERRSAR
jgi:hypothetical protein